MAPAHHQFLLKSASIALAACTVPQTPTQKHKLSNQLQNGIILFCIYVEFGGECWLSDT
jgi:hypothetical protein